MDQYTHVVAPALSKLEEKGGYTLDDLIAECGLLEDQVTGWLREKCANFSDSPNASWVILKHSFSKEDEAKIKGE